MIPITPGRSVLIERGSATRDCAVCGRLAAEEQWGEGIPWAHQPGSDAPPSFEDLEWCGGCGTNLYCCPECGAYFDLRVGSNTFLAGNSSWDDYTLSRHRPHSAPDLADADPAVRRDAARLLALDLSRSGDYEGLERTLLRHADAAVRREALAALAGRVVGSYPPPVSVGRPVPTRGPSASLDLEPLEEALRRLLGDAPEIAAASARALARHLLLRGRQSELESLLAAAPAVREGARCALRDAVNDGFTGSGKAEAAGMLMRHHVGAGAWKDAATLLNDLPTREGAANAARELAVGGPGAADLVRLVPALVAACQTPLPAWRREAYAAAEAALASLLDSGDAALRRATAEALRDASVKDESAQHRLVATRALLLHAVQSRAWNEATELLHQPKTRSNAVQTLRELAAGQSAAADLSPLEPTLAQSVVASGSTSGETREVAKALLAQIRAARG